MINLTQGAGEVVAGDVRNTVAAYDNALLTSARMCASVIEAAQDAGIPIGQSQMLLGSITASMTSVIEGRGGLVDAVRHLLAIKKASTLAYYDYGCPTGLDESAPVAAQPATTPAAPRAPVAA